MDWHPEDIKAAIRKRGETLTSLGRRCQIDQRLISLALIYPHKAAEAAISGFLCVPAHTIWPSRYHADGRRKRPQPAQNYDRKPRAIVTGAAA